MMEVTVTMSAEEFQEFMEWKKDRAYCETKLEAETNKVDILAKKVCWAIAKDPKKPGKVKIVDQEHAAELMDMADDRLS